MTQEEMILAVEIANRMANSDASATENEEIRDILIEKAKPYFDYWVSKRTYEGTTPSECTTCTTWYNYIEALKNINSANPVWPTKPEGN